MNMNIEISKEQFKDLLLAAMLYSWIRGGVADSRGEDFQVYEKLEEHLLQIAKENGLDNYVEEFQGGIVPVDDLSIQVEEIVNEYEDDSFWHELITRLGQRDFLQTITPQERVEMENNNTLPTRVHEFYEKYDEEFDKNGIENLKMK